MLACNFWSQSEVRRGRQGVTWRLRVCHKFYTNCARTSCRIIEISCKSWVNHIKVKSRSLTNFKYKVLILLWLLCNKISFWVRAIMIDVQIKLDFGYRCSWHRYSIRLLYQDSFNNHLSRHITIADIYIFLETYCVRIACVIKWYSKRRQSRSNILIIFIFVQCCLNVTAPWVRVDEFLPKLVPNCSWKRRSLPKVKIETFILSLIRKSWRDNCELLSIWRI